MIKNKHWFSYACKANTKKEIVLKMPAYKNIKR